MKNDESKMLNQIKKIVTKQELTAKIYLYGSSAQGTTRNNSDWDLLILLNKDKVSSADEQKIVYPLYDLEFDTCEVLFPHL